MVLLSRSAYRPSVAVPSRRYESLERTWHRILARDSVCYPAVDVRPLMGRGASGKRSMDVGLGRTRARRRPGAISSGG